MRNLIWFRRDLRTIDNTALIEGIARVIDAQKNGEEGGVMALFVATPEQWAEHNLAPMQADLIQRRCAKLSDELKALNIPLIFHQWETFAKTTELLPRLCEEHGITSVLVNTEYELNEVKRDDAIAVALESKGIAFETFSDKCVFAPGSILNKQGSYFKVFTPFKKTWLQRFATLPLIVNKPSMIKNNVFAVELACSDFSFSYPLRNSELWSCDSKAIIARLREFAADAAVDYQQDRDFPAIDGTSQLSPYLAIGALSVRQCIARLLNGRHLDQLSEGEQTWLSELIWREFYQHLLYFVPKLSQSRGFVDWTDKIAWQGELNHFECWKKGETGYPIVDAAMKQLNQTGWMHNRLRMIVASFLTKDLLIDWRLGETYFMQQLVDGDYAANNGGWQWSASTGCDAQPYFRIFNPISQGQKFDQDGSFVKQWLPELKSVPTKSIHSPWLWNKSASLDYPQPIVDHKIQREKALQMYKGAKNSGQEAP